MERLVTFEQFAEQKAKKDQIRLEEELNAKREASANSFKDLLAEFGVTSMGELSEEDKPKFNERLGTLTESALLLEGTRSQVGKIDKNGKITSVYVHYDGYPDYMVPMIKNYDKKGVDQLLDLGKAGISVLDKEIGKKQDFNNPKRGWTLFYGRDRGENSNMISTGNAGNIKAYLKDMANDSSAEYVYLYDERDGNWYYADAYGDTTLTLVESLSEAVAISGKRTANKVALRLNKLFTDKLTAIAADKVTMLGFLKELYFSAMEDANFYREAGISMNMIKGKLGPLEVKVAGLDNEAIKISAKTVKLMVDKYYSDLANAGDWSGIGITEGFAMYLDQIGESNMAQALLDSFNAQFEGEEKRVSRTEKLYELSQKNVEEDRAEEIEDDGIEMANEAKESAWDKLNRIADEQYGEFGFATLGEDEMANHIDMKKADKLADKEYGEFGFATLGEGEMEELINNNPKLVKESAVTEATKPTEVKDAEKALKLKSEEHYDIDGVWVIGAQDKVQFQWSSEYGGYSVGDENGTELYNGTDLKAAVKAYKKAINESVNEAEIKSDDEFKEYAFTVLQKAFGEDFDEAKAQEVVDGILGKVDGDYGKAAGILQASLG